MPHIFSQWQAEYAARGVPTFPVRLERDDDGEIIKKPAIRGYLKTGSTLSAQWVLKFPDIDAFGFVCGESKARTKITTLDVDTTDERVLADSQNRHGATPIIVRTASGKFHGWYRHNGERRRIRPTPGLPIDILGTEASALRRRRGPTGSHEIIQGSLMTCDCPLCATCRRSRRARSGQTTASNSCCKAPATPRFSMRAGKPPATVPQKPT
jgi:hypothetical protein